MYTKEEVDYKINIAATESAREAIKNFKNEAKSHFKESIKPPKQASESAP